MSLYDPVDTLAAPALLTPWSATHAALGVLLVSVGMYLSDNRAVVFAVAFALHALYELKDYLGSYGSEDMQHFSHAFYRAVGVPEDPPDLFENSALNGVGDMLCFTVGQAAALYVITKQPTAKKWLVALSGLVLLWFYTAGARLNLG
jgi:hypothetical protein